MPAFGIVASDSGGGGPYPENPVFQSVSIVGYGNGAVIFAGLSGLLLEDDGNFNYNSTSKVLTLNGYIRSKINVVATTAGSGSPLLLTALDSMTTYTNEGASAKVYITLPSAVSGLSFSFIIQNSVGIRVVANAGDTIRNLSEVSAAAGYMESLNQGDTATIQSINGTEWIFTSASGAWTIV